MASNEKCDETRQVKHVKIWDGFTHLEEVIERLHRLERRIPDKPWSKEVPKQCSTVVSLEETLNILPENLHKLAEEANNAISEIESMLF